MSEESKLIRIVSMLSDFSEVNLKILLSMILLELKDCGADEKQEE